MIIRSIKWRLQLWHGSLLVLLLMGMLTGFFFYERRALLHSADNEILNAIEPIMPVFAPPPLWGPPDRGPRRHPEPPANRFDLPDFARDDFYYVIFSREGDRISGSTNAPAGLTVPGVEQSEPRIFRTRGEYREMVQRSPSGRWLIAGRSITAANERLNKLAWQLAGVGAAIVLAGFGMGWWLASRALLPIRAMSGTAQEIAAGDLSRRIDVPETGSELGQLATVLNSTFSRLEAAFNQQRQFTSDAAHELRTPVSVILAQTQSTLRKDRTEREYREALEACMRAAQRMKGLIESLLELARWDAGQESLRPAPCNLRNIAASSLELVLPLAQERGITLEAELQDAPCIGDSDRLGQVLTNIVTNAILHNTTGKHVRVLTGARNGTVTATILDDGPGIPQEALPRIFERFYRADQSRSTTNGGTGLGLAIAKAIVEAHGGSIEVSSQVGQGAEFKVSLPSGA